MGYAKVSTVSSPDDATGYVVDEQIGYLLRIAMQRHANIFSSLMVKGLTAPQFAALSKLSQVGACSQNQLGRLVYLDVASTKGVVERLRSKGFISLRNDPDDGRRHEITITPAGRKALRRAMPIGKEITERTLAPLGAKERGELKRLLKKIGYTAAP
jgi:DNA-binding MarR family transcriptional regulator